MASKIPTHHVKQTVCATRPPYREGKHPKAVKVYTVNNESQYILIQGVPAVGAMQELSKLCSTFGPVDQFNALDDYPSQDIYSEVYLIKYKKIQSARFAKRKLDEYSFFGGNLHVCYAPEYETVSETREKLMERRRVIASKIRQHAGETVTNKMSSATRQPVGSFQNPSNLHQTSSLAVEVPRSQFELTYPMSSQEHPVSNLEVHSSNSIASKHQNNLTHFQRKGQTQPVNPNPLLEDVIFNRPENMPETFELPLPPRVEAVSQSGQFRTKNKRELSRVPSSHAGLPAGYDGRLNIDVPSPANCEKSLGDISQNTAPSPVPQHGHFMSFSNEGTDSKRTLSSSTILVKKDYKPSSAAPRFVPRQALKNTESGSIKTAVSQPKKDALDQEIRRNAFQLGESQGPADLPNRKREHPTTEQKSVNQTIHEIRSKISKVINEGVRKK